MLHPRLPWIAFLLASALLLAACGDEDPQQDPCRGVVCPQGFDCVAGECREREVPEPPTGCEVNADCFQNPAGAFCDRGSGACVACLTDDHCGARRCSAGACVGSVCGDDDDCPAEAPFCNEAGDACVACRTAEDCGAGETCDTGVCVDAPVECTSDEECAAQVPDRPICDRSGERGLCVECRDGIDCADGLDCLGGACFDLSCTSDEDCDPFPDLRHCGEAGRCVGCERDEHCAAGEVCDGGACVDPGTCSRDEDCAATPETPVCDVSTGACVTCRDDADCPLGARCEGRVACVPIECEDAGGCPIGARCDDGVCVDPGPCASDADCGFDPRAPRCNDAGRCVACTVDAHCGAGERCIGETCVVPQACTSDAQCPGGGVCAGGLCATCRTDAECPRGTCRLGACVDPATCVDDLDCAAGVCAGGTCVACATTLDCNPGQWCEGGACVPVPACAGADEPNDAPLAATPFAAGAPVSATLCPGDVDWWVFSAPAGAGLNANLIGAPAGTALELHWFDPDTGALERLRGIGGKVRVRALPAASQARYYLRVIGGPDGGGYGLLATVTAGGLACGDLLEPNNLRTSARAVEVGWLEGLDLCGDDDFYLVDVPAGRPLHAAIFTASVEAPLALEIFTGGGESRLAVGTPHAWLGGGLVATVPAGAARTLLVKVSRPGASGQIYDLFTSTDADAPSCATAPELFDGGDRVRIEASTIGFAADQPAGACGGGGPDRAFRIHLDEAQRLVAELDAPWPARLSLRDGDCAAEIACGAVLASGTGVLDAPHLPAGDYTLVVAGVPGAAGPFELAARLRPPLAAPPNDACGAVDLVLVDGHGSAAGHSEGAIADATVSCAPGAPDVFHTFEVPAPDPARVVIDLQASGPASLALFDEACAAERSCAGPSSSSRIDTVLAPGRWTVAVAASSGAPVAYDLDVTLPPAIGNDTCASATPLAVGSGISGDTTWAANDLSLGAPAASCTGYFTAGNDVFYALALEAGETIEVTLVPAADYDAAVYLLDACDGTCLVGADAALAGGPEGFAFTAAAAGTYYLVVDGGTGGGGYTLQVEPGAD